MVGQVSIDGFRAAGELSELSEQRIHPSNINLTTSDGLQLLRGNSIMRSPTSENLAFETGFLSAMSCLPHRTLHRNPVSQPSRESLRNYFFSRRNPVPRGLRVSCRGQRPLTPTGICLTRSANRLASLVLLLRNSGAGHSPGERFGLVFVLAPNSPELMTIKVHFSRFVNPERERGRRGAGEQGSRGAGEQKFIRQI